MKEKNYYTYHSMRCLMHVPMTGSFSELIAYHTSHYVTFNFFTFLLSYSTPDETDLDTLYLSRKSSFLFPIDPREFSRAFMSIFPLSLSLSLTPSSYLPPQKLLALQKMFLRHKEMICCLLAVKVNWCPKDSSWIICSNLVAADFTAIWILSTKQWGKRGESRCMCHIRSTWQYSAFYWGCGKIGSTISAEFKSNRADIKHALDALF